MQKLEYVDLHTHDEGSPYDGMGKAKQRAAVVKGLGQTHLSITNHGRMTTCIDTYQACRDAGIKFIPGVEGYMTAGDFIVPGTKITKSEITFKDVNPGVPLKLEDGTILETKDIQGLYTLPHSIEFASKDMGRYHITLLARSEEGYSSLCQASSEAWCDQFYSKPLMTFETLKKYSKDVVCLSGCVLGLLSQTLLHGTFDQACYYTEQFLTIFQENFYFEVQPQNFEAQFRANEGIIKLAEKFGRPIVMTNDSHMPGADDVETYIQLRKMNFHPPAPKKRDAPDPNAKEKVVEDSDDMFAVKIADFETGIRDQYGNLYIQSGESMLKRWQATMGTDGTEYIRESQRIANQIDVQFTFEELVPNVVDEIDPQTQKPMSPVKALARDVVKGLKRLGLWNATAERTKKDGTIEIYRPYFEEASYEIEVIAENGSASYFLLCADLIREARKRNIAVGPGRGSGGASLVAYALGIIEVDPIKNGCNFNRFMNKARKKLPDIDMDFDPYRRRELFEYLEQKFLGRGAMICNINRLAMASLVNDLCKVMQVPDTDRDLMKRILSTLGFGKDKTEAPVYSKLLKNNELRRLNVAYPDIVLHFCKLFGQIRSFSEHASGFALSSELLSKKVPLFVRNSKGRRKIYTEYDMDALSQLGVLKIDVLGLDAVTVLQMMCQLTGKDYHDIPFDDSNTFAGYQACNVAGVSQVESDGAQAIIRAVQPENMQELIACISLNRPGSLEMKQVVELESGPKEMNQLEIYVAGKNGEIDLSTPIAQCCQDTYGALIYDEHKLEICRRIAGLDWEITMKIIKQNHTDEAGVKALRGAFVQGCMTTSGMTEKEAEDLYYIVLSYTFNKGHASPYATLSYWLMYMKQHYPFEFYLATLRLEGSQFNREKYEIDAFKNNVPVLIPHVNGAAHYEFVGFQGERVIRAGLASIKGVGDVAANAIEKEWREHGDYISEEDLIERVNGFDMVLRGRKPNKYEVKVVRGTPITSKVLESLRVAGALEFDPKIYKQLCIKYYNRIIAEHNLLQKRRWRSA